MSRAPDLVVASVPARHAYTRNLLHPAVPMRHVATPAATYRAGQMVDPAWVDANADRIDAVAIHFGFGDVPLPQMRRWRQALRRHGIPLTYVVHDLTNPHVEDQDGHRRRRDLLLAQADRLVTLTDAAADQVVGLCGRRPTVIPHPHVVDLGRMDRPRLRRDPRPRRDGDTFRIGLHAKDHRPGIDALPWVEGLLALMRDRHDVVLRLDLRPLLAERHPALDRRLTALAAHPRVEVHRTGFWPDPLLWDYLADVDLVVLPYRLGTHSGWAEACADLGTAVVAPAHLPVVDQHPAPWIRPVPAEEDGPDPAALAAAVDAVRLGPPTPPLTARWRERQRLAIAQAHLTVLREAIHDQAIDEGRRGRPRRAAA